MSTDAVVSVRLTGRVVDVHWSRSRHLTVCLPRTWQCQYVSSGMVASHAGAGVDYYSPSVFFGGVFFVAHLPPRMNGLLPY